MKKLSIILCLVFFCLLTSNVHAQKKLSDSEIFARKYVLKPEQVKIADREYLFGSDIFLYKIERKKTETLVTFLQPIYFDSQWILYTKGFTIIDKKSGKKCPAISFLDETIPIDRVLVVQGFNNKVLYITLKFPPLKRSVKTIDLIEYEIADNPAPSNNTGDMTQYFDIKLKDFSPKRVAKSEKILMKYK